MERSPWDKSVSHSPEAEQAISQYMSRVYLWMTIGILLTAAVAVGISSSVEIMTVLFSNSMVFYGVIIAEFALVIWLSRSIATMSTPLAASLFLVYAALNGVTFSFISLAYTQESVASAFITTSIAFAGLTTFGFVTKKDLGPIGSFCTMGLFGLFGFGLITLFWPSLMGSVTSQVYGLVGIIVFAGLTAYDTQKIKQMAVVGKDGAIFERGAIMGALKLYLDFVNLFLFILRMSGNRRK